MPQAQLSKHDQEVLNTIFNPLELTTNLMPGVINPEVSNELSDNEPDTDLVRTSKEFEIKAVQLAEQGKLATALENFEEAIKIAPKRASIYNNRAQALRLANKDDAAFTDLNKAIELSDENYLKTKCHAYCQRGVLYRKLEKLDEARIDFEAAAKLGSNFAKQQLVEINPYAALCNQMLRQAFDQLK